MKEEVRPNCLHTAHNSTYFVRAAALCSKSKKQSNNLEYRVVVAMVCDSLVTIRCCFAGTTIMSQQRPRRVHHFECPPETVSVVTCTPLCLVGFFLFAECFLNFIVFGLFGI